MTKRTEDMADISPVDGIVAQPETIAADDLCPICHLLLYQPATTTCHHEMCRYCLNMWADVSVTTQMTAVGIDEHTFDILLPNEIESNCPMCRRSTTADVNPARERELEKLYPRAYAERREEARRDEEHDLGAGVESITLYVGNTHTLIRVNDEDEDTTHNRHEWKFFVRPSRTEIIEEVQIFLHPTFRNPRLLIQHPPYEVRRLGWGYFTIYANVVLKAGYQWISSDAEDSPDGVEKGSLPLEWMLDFDGPGSQKRCRIKVRKEKEGIEREFEGERERVRRLWAMQRERDPDWLDEGEDED